MLETKQFDYSPVLGWSISRYDTFSTCKRRYYYQYYAKHDPDHSRGRIDALKNLTSIPLEIGHIVHDTISTVLKRLLQSSSEIDRGRFRDFVEREAEESCKNKTFFEVHYGEMQAVMPEDILPAVTGSLDAFLESERFKWITDEAVGNSHHWLIEPPGYGETRVGDLKAYCKVDFLFAVDGRIVILDWKTGKQVEDKHRKQLLGYSTWAAHHLDAAASDIEPVIAYLRPSYEEVNLTPSDADLEGFAAQISTETDEMQSLCSDIEENIPVDKASFSMTSHSAICDYCHFKELCDRG